MNTANDPMPPDPTDELMLFDAYRASSQEAERDADPMEIAAWLDETLDDDETAAVESQMARDAVIRELASAHRLEPDLVADPPSPGLLKRLHALRTAPSTPLRLKPPAHRSSSRAWWASSAAAAGIVIAIAGFLAGRLAATPSYSNENRFLATATFNVFDDDTASEFDPVMFTINDDVEGEQ